MAGGRARQRRGDALDLAAGAALAVLAAAALAFAVRLGASASDGGDLLAELRAKTERRLGAERAQIRGVLEAVSRGEADAAHREAEAALRGLEGNSQLHLFLAGSFRARGLDGRALREYRRGVELVRDYADRRASCYVGPQLGTWLGELRPRLERRRADAQAAAALADLHFLERALAGGCG